MQNNTDTQELTMKEKNKIAHKQKMVIQKIKDFQEYQEMQKHESKYLKDQNISEDELIPFIEEQLEKEMKKRNKKPEQIQNKMKKNTSYAKKIVDKAIKEYKLWKEEA